MSCQSYCSFKDHTLSYGTRCVYSRLSFPLVRSCWSCVCDVESVYLSLPLISLFFTSPALDLILISYLPQPKINPLIHLPTYRQTRSYYPAAEVSHILAERSSLHNGYKFQDYFSTMD